MEKIQKFDGEKMDKLREKAGLSLGKIVSGMIIKGHDSFTRTHYCYYKENKHKPNVDVALHLAEIIGCSVEDFSG